MIVSWNDHAKQRFNAAETMLVQSWLAKVDPSDTPIAPVWSKLRMAYLRSTELEWFLWAYLIDRPYKIVCTTNADGSEHVLHVEFDEQPDFLFWGNILAEFAYNLRTAFDQLVYLLSKSENGGNQTAGTRMPKNIKMPIFKSAQASTEGDSKGFFCGGRGGGQECIRKITNPRLRDAIEEVQPYHSETGNFEDHPLWIINELCNTDKHREALPISLRANFDYLWQRGGVPVELSNWEWKPKHFWGQSDTEIGRFISPHGHSINVGDEVTLVPAIEAVTLTPSASFRIVGGSPIPNGELALPSKLFDFVESFMKRIGTDMGWSTQRISYGVPRNTTDDVLPRKWLPGRKYGAFKPFVPTDMLGKPIRLW